MAQLTIYMDNNTAKQIEEAARAEHSSVSKWIKNRIIRFFQREWPQDFIKTLGSLNEKDLQVPEELLNTHDRPREKL